MKQIKTIYKTMDPKIVGPLEVEDFDRQVNEALQDGWKLVKRDVFHPNGNTSYDYHRVLYAEMERDDCVPKYASCDNCAHLITEEIPSEAAMRRCFGCKQMSRWAPRQEGWKA